jgi:Ca-activated chloride channel family protein
MKFTATTDCTTVHASHGGQRFIVAEIVAPAAAEDKPRPNVDIAFVLDRSGSMAGDKFRLARKAIEQAIRALAPTDNFSVVIYDNEIDIVQPATPASHEAKQAAISRLHDVSPRGTTNLSEGWLVGCGQVAEHLTDDRIGRCLLLTDGLANVGITDPGILAHHARELRKRGVSTSTFGVGSDFDEVLMGQMADAGGGGFIFIERPEQIPGLIANELGDTLEIVARDVVIDLRIGGDISVRPMGPYPWMKNDEGVQIMLPDLVSKQLLQIPLEIAVPGGPVGDAIALDLKLSDREGVFDLPAQHLRWTRIERRGGAAPVNLSIQALVATRLAALARQESAALNRDGQFHAAKKRISEVLFRLENQFELTKTISSIIRKLKRDADRVGQNMDAISRKKMHHESTTIAMGGSITGQLRQRSS